MYACGKSNYKIVYTIIIIKFNYYVLLTSGVVAFDTILAEEIHVQVNLSLSTLSLSTL